MQHTYDRGSLLEPSLADESADGRKAPHHAGAPRFTRIDDPHSQPSPVIVGVTAISNYENDHEARER